MNLNLRTCLIVVSRIVGVYFLVVALYTLSMGLISGGSFGASMLVSVFGHIVLLQLLLGFLFWRFARQLADAILKGV